MKKNIYIMAVMLLSALTGCSDFTEVQPKGKNTLSRVEDLNLVLNYTYSCRMPEVYNLVNDIYPQLANIPNLLNESIKTPNGIFTTWDEKADRVSIADADSKYTKLYGMIGQVANPVLLNVDGATGDRILAAQLKAEALVLRAWCHYLLVNFYAKAYVPQTAASDPGIVYSKETDDMTVPNEKLSVAQIYELILADLEEALALNSLPVTANKMRIGLPFAYAVKAKVLMSMHDYEGAFTAAGEVLKLKNTIDDYNDLLAGETMFGTGKLEFIRPQLSCEEELFETPSMFFWEAFTSEMWEAFEEGHVVKEYLLTDRSVYGFSVMGNQYYGLDIPALLSMNVYYSPIGLTTVDMYLVQAECYIREGKTEEAMMLLNRIREKRIVTGKYTKKEAATPAEAFAWLKRISRTESFCSPKTFINLKRWNTETAYRETLRRTITYTVNTYGAEGEVTGTEQKTATYTLAPDSPLWIFPFPQNATLYNPNLTQNY